MATLALLGLQGCVHPAAPLEPFFAIAPGEIASATVRVDGVDAPPGWPAFGEANDPPPPYPEKRCRLGAPQIAASLAILQHSRVPEGDRDGLASDLTFFFITRSGERVVAVISKAHERIGGDYPIFFRGRLAMLGPVDVAKLTRIAAQAGCAQ